MSWKYLFETRNRLIPPIFVQLYRPEDFSLFGFNRIKIGQVTRSSTGIETDRNLAMVNPHFHQEILRTSYFYTGIVLTKALYWTPWILRLKPLWKLIPHHVCMYWMSPNYPLIILVIGLLPFRWIPHWKGVRPSQKMVLLWCVVQDWFSTSVMLLLLSVCSIPMFGGLTFPILVAQPTKHRFSTSAKKGSIIGVCSCALSNWWTAGMLIWV